MWPWGHLAVGYLLYSITVHLRTRHPPNGTEIIALAFGTQFPDLVDKPLAWTLGVLPNGRSLTHSLLVAALVIVLVEVVLRRHNYGPIATGFAVGYLSHLFGDALGPALAGEYYYLGFLAWPLVPAIEYSSEPSFAAHLNDLSVSVLLVPELVLGILTLVLWIYDGMPGLDVIKAVSRWAVRKVSV